MSYKSHGWASVAIALRGRWVKHVEENNPAECPLNEISVPRSGKYTLMKL